MKERVVMTEAYLDLRERSWSKASDAVRTGNAAEAAEARALEVGANKMARSFGD